MPLGNSDVATLEAERRSANLPAQHGVITPARLLNDRALKQRAKGSFLALGVMTIADVEWMLERGIRLKVPAGTVLIAEGQRYEFLYVIMEGALRVSVKALEDLELATLGPREILGEISFVDYRPCSATVTALEDSVILALPHQELVKQMNRDSDFAIRFYHTICIFLADRVRKAALR